MLTYEHLKEKELLYRTGYQAADAIYSALFHAETDEVCATDFEGSPKLYKIVALKEHAKGIRDRLDGAHRVLMKLRLSIPESELPEADLQMSYKYLWLVCKKLKLNETENEALSA